MATIPARANWIADYFQAHDLCGPGFPGLNALLTRDGAEVLLARPAEAWTRDDLVSLPRLFAQCRQIALARGVQIDLTAALPDFERIVARAWMEREQRFAQADAAARLEAEASRQTTARVQEELARAQVNQRLAETALAAAREQAQQEIARDNALAAVAEARRDVEHAQRQAAEAKAMAMRAQAEAVETRRLAQADGLAAKPGDPAQSRPPSPTEAQVSPQRPAEAPPLGSPAPVGSTRVRIGQRAKVVVGFLGCRRTEDYTELKRLAVGGDALAAARYAGEHGCDAVQQGTLGTVEDVTVFSDASCLREAGEPYCVWLPSSFLTRVE